MTDPQGVPRNKLVLGPENEHFWLVQRMAKATGVDLVQAADLNIMTQHDWADIVTHCRGCDWSQSCGRWLKQSQDAERALPENCVNRSRLAEIKAELSEVEE